MPAGFSAPPAHQRRRFLLRAAHHQRLFIVSVSLLRQHHTSYTGKCWTPGRRRDTRCPSTDAADLEDCRKLLSIWKWEEEESEKIAISLNTLIGQGLVDAYISAVCCYMCSRWRRVRAEREVGWIAYAFKKKKIKK